MTARQLTSRALAPPATYTRLPLARWLHYLKLRDCEDSPMEISDVACRIPGRWEHRDHASGRPVCRGIRQGCKGVGDALQDFDAAGGEFIGGDLRRRGR